MEVGLPSAEDTTDLLAGRGYWSRMMLGSIQKVS
jgi:hypothetical protein